MLSNRHTDRQTDPTTVPSLRRCAEGNNFTQYLSCSGNRVMGHIVLVYVEKGWHERKDISPNLLLGASLRIADNAALFC